MRKEGLVVPFKMPRPILKLINQFLGHLTAHFHRLQYIDVTMYSYKQYQAYWNVLTFQEQPQTVNVLVRHMLEAYVRMI